MTELICLGIVVFGGVFFGGFLGAVCEFLGGSKTIQKIYRKWVKQ